MVDTGPAVSAASAYGGTPPERGASAIRREVLMAAHEGSAHAEGVEQRGIGEATEDGDVAGERNAEANGDGKLSEGSRTAHEHWQIVGERIFCARDTSAGNEIEEAAGDAGDDV